MDFSHIQPTLQYQNKSQLAGMCNYYNMVQTFALL